MAYSLTVYFSTEQDKEDFKANFNKKEEVKKVEVVKTTKKVKK